MMIRFGQISKVITGTLLTAAALLLTSCGQGSGEETSTVSIQKDGTISSHIKEAFDRSYYDGDELQQSILQAAADYNRAAGSGQITVEKIDVDDGTVTVKMVYQSSEDYADFNRTVFFAGSPKDAESKKFDLNVVLSHVKDTNETIGKSDILAMDDYRLLILKGPEAVLLNGQAEYVSDDVTVYLNGRAEYISDNVTVSSNRKSVKLSEEGLGYVLYK